MGIIKKKGQKVWKTGHLTRLPPYNSVVPLPQQIINKTEPRCESMARAFPRLTLAKCIHFVSGSAWFIMLYASDVQ